MVLSIWNYSFLIPTLKFSCIKAFFFLNIYLKKKPKNITLFTNKCRHL